MPAPRLFRRPQRLGGMTIQSGACIASPVVDQENHGHTCPDRRQPPQCLEKHRAPDGRGQGGVELECGASWDDRAGNGGARRRPGRFRAVSGGAAGRAGAKGRSRGGAHGNGRARGLATSAGVAGGSRALQARHGQSAASRAHDARPLRGSGQPQVSPRAHAAGAWPEDRGLGRKRNRQEAKSQRWAARTPRSCRRNPIFARGPAPNPLAHLSSWRFDQGRWLSRKIAKRREKPGKTVSDRPKSRQISRAGPAPSEPLCPIAARR